MISAIEINNLNKKPVIVLEVLWIWLHKQNIWLQPKNFWNQAYQKFPKFIMIAEKSELIHKSQMSQKGIVFY